MAFQQLPKSVKRTIRYIHQDVDSIEKLEELQKIINYSINKKKKRLTLGTKKLI
ncbi:LytR family transcriptional regulator [Mesobacillus maritimus]|uniref:LytR family transcriptional regulator n=1 Tax=Mesobacillus maritimus TaxID=1643336 RepID=UPI00203E138B|nr:LytR family transcriptional regulator [Mesobacillus maritimus]MCM3588285.1 LytR family transcriptional regulator [Mesobacillus maritimus]MCM3672096.1 LytR family transcriptional regulator [Mesobacillus maritimus]